MNSQTEYERICELRAEIDAIDWSCGRPPPVTGAAGLPYVVGHGQSHPLAEPVGAAGVVGRREWEARAVATIRSMLAGLRSGWMTFEVMESMLTALAEQRKEGSR